MNEGMLVTGYELVKFPGKGAGKAELQILRNGSHLDKDFYASGTKSRLPRPCPPWSQRARDPTLRTDNGNQR
jgi:hypothetical protein